MNIQLHLTWKLTAISLRENTFQKPSNQASVLHRNYMCKLGYTAGLKTNAAIFLADHTLGRVNCKNVTATTLSPPPK